VVVLSAYVDTQQQLPVEVTFRKPIRIKTLLAKLRELLPSPAELNKQVLSPAPNHQSMGGLLAYLVSIQVTCCQCGLRLGTYELEIPRGVHDAFHALLSRRNDINLRQRAASMRCRA